LIGAVRRLCPRRLLTANLLERRQVIPHDVTQHIVRDTLVFMARHVADGGNLRLWNFRMTGFQLVAEMPAGLGDDFDPALDQQRLRLSGPKASIVTPAISLRISPIASMMSASRGTGDGGAIKTLVEPRPRSARAEPGASCDAS
jgi:hypothetical protein